MTIHQLAGGNIRTLICTPNKRLLQINFTTKHTTVTNHRKWKKRKEADKK